MIPVHVAIVDTTSQIDPAQLQQLAGALNEQVHADFAPAWGVQASVGVYATPPAVCWQIQIKEALDQPGALGYHTDANNQPVSYVEFTNSWPVTVSHELLEMLADPFGNRLHTAELPEGLADRFAEFGLTTPSDRVHYLLEVCDPCEATTYPVGGGVLSDFLLSDWYRSAPGSGVSYSHAGGCQQPREVANGGYVSFSTDAGAWWQVFNENGSYQVNDLSSTDRTQFASLREFSDSQARAHRANGAAGS